MNWFKKTFGKRHWKTVFSGTCYCGKSYNFGMSYYKVKAEIYLQIEEERNKHRCFVSDGDISKDFPIYRLVTIAPEVIPILEQYGIEY